MFIKNDIHVIPAEDFSALTKYPTIVKGTNNIVKANLEKVFFRGTQFFGFSGNNNELIIEEGTTLINSRIQFSGDHSRMVISKNCRISLNTHICGQNCMIGIDEETTMERVLIVCHEDGSKIMIGKDCMFSSDVFIRTSDSHSIIDLKTDKRINPPMDVVIGNHVWVGQSVKINKGVTIEDHSIIANAAVVTGPVPANTVFGGNPARMIKEGVRWERELLPL